MPGSRRALFAGATVRPVAPIFPLTEELIFPETEGVSGQGTRVSATVEVSVPVHEYQPEFR